MNIIIYFFLKYKKLVFSYINKYILILQKQLQSIDFKNTIYVSKVMGIYQTIHICLNVLLKKR